MTDREAKRLPGKARAALIAAILVLAGCGPARAATPRERAWNILKEAASDKNAERRSEAIRALGLISGNREARAMATKALSDDRSEVRAAAATALGEQHDRASIPALKKALSDKDPAVVLAAAHALLVLKDSRAYDVYYAVLTGERKSGDGVISEQLKTLQDPKKMAEIGIETGLGFVPFAGYGWTAVKMLTKDDSSRVRAAATTILTNDRDPRTHQALVNATTDKSWLVREAALEAIARRDRPGVLREIKPAMDDTKDAVRYTAAAAVIHLTDHRRARASRAEARLAPTGTR